MSFICHQDLDSGTATVDFCSVFYFDKRQKESPLNTHEEDIYVLVMDATLH